MRLRIWSGVLILSVVSMFVLSVWPRYFHVERKQEPQFPSSSTEIIHDPCFIKMDSKECDSSKAEMKKRIERLEHGEKVKPSKVTLLGALVALGTALLAVFKIVTAYLDMRIKYYQLCAEQGKAKPGKTKARR